MITESIAGAAPNTTSPSSNHVATASKRSASDAPSPEPKRTNTSKSSTDLDLQFEMALESHSHGDSNGASVPSAAKSPTKSPTKSSGDISQSTNNNTHEPTTNSPNDTPKPARTVLHQGVEIPADSELLNSSSAFTAYTELSHQLSHQLSSPAMTTTHLTALPMAIVAADFLPPRTQLLVNTLPSLDNLATQILRIFTVGPYQKIIDLVSNVDTAAGASFRDLTSLFEFTKKLYSDEDPFLAVSHVAPGTWNHSESTPAPFKNREQSIESTLRKVNLATFLLATLGVIEVGFFYLNESFLGIFCPLNNLDPHNSLSNHLENTGSTVGGSTPGAGDRIGKLLKSQAILYLDLKTQAYISAIEAGERSRVEVLDDILPDNLDAILMEKRSTKILSPTESDFIDRCKSRRTILLNYPDNSTLSEEYDWFSFLRSLFEFVGKNMLFLIWGNKKITKPRPDDTKPAAATAPLSGDEPATSGELTDTLLPSEILEKQLHVQMAHGPGRISMRRPWTREEEKALRHALELAGPHWSKILELFGAGGKVSEALKNRTQVQLKDKARNWKMFFLKSGLPVPQYLSKVTGDLERDDRSKRAKKTAAAPIPNIAKAQAE
ncbi:hypothetical protein CANTEDRAFT_127045 [Yamadazyma tenuis ATCC 10573]|uniref:Uncharacterized protein n=2 Tax=Candida tenuis TaxID=2315449 RepID=G3BC67_CANTC|nr:uncharacterized protein CANTEDRAFT_127045 [Yamadazyma tenuis ATCC 10573]EGV60132.1 hypothetical protein CANTEDRAFT_127045 [Yamadazyma tenuis ATCC 10573]